MREYRDRIVQELAAGTRDRCGRRMTPDEASIWYEMVSLDFDGGFGSVFGDSAHMSLDPCQHCLRDTLGAWLRVTPATTNNPALKQLMARTPVWDKEVAGSPLTALKGTVRREAEAVSIDEMNASIVAAAAGRLADLGGSQPGIEDLPRRQQDPLEWNYLVMEFQDRGETWLEFREVFYENGEPAGYSSVGASARWSEDDEAARRILGNMRNALAKPVLRPGDFGGREKDEGKPQ